MRNIAILGSTGSIGTQALEVIGANPQHFQVELLTANGNADLLIQQAIKFKPNTVVIADESKYEYVKEVLSSEPVKVFTGLSAITELMASDDIHVVLTAMVGFAGLSPTLAAIRNKKTIALANKETLVVAGELITELAINNKVAILPVDSEHSAIFQCLAGETINPIEKIILTASGGPFRGKKTEDLLHITKVQALKHPNWTMGAKITIDSASLMNKGLEMIEAKWLFELNPSQIEVIVHPQSIIHSIVQFCDGSMKAQMGLPDMKLPIQYALAYPQRIKSDFPRFDFLNYSQFTFEQPDEKTFQCLKLARTAMESGGNAPCILNAANEIAVASFLADELGFLQIAEVIDATLQQMTWKKVKDIEEFFDIDKQARELTLAQVRSKKVVISSSGN
jgi:1-deoxy-D-xylulose-5-phosphate reductoisomerase